MSTPPLTASANHRHSIKFSTTDQVLIRPGLTRESGAWGVRRGAGSVGRGLQINAIGLGFGGGQKGLEGFNTGLGEPAGGGEPEVSGQLLDIPAQGAQRVGQPDEPGVAAHFTDRAESADGAELLQDVGIPQQRAFKGRRLPRG